MFREKAPATMTTKNQAQKKGNNGKEKQTWQKVKSLPVIDCYYLHTMVRATRSAIGEQT